MLESRAVSKLLLADAAQPKHQEASFRLGALGEHSTRVALDAIDIDDGIMKRHRRLVAGRPVPLRDRATWTDARHQEDGAHSVVHVDAQRRAES